MSFGKSKFFWRNKRVLITGAKGFVGSNLARRLIKSGAKVCSLDRTKISENPHQREITGSVEDFLLVKRIIKNEGIDIVYHLAGQALVGEGELSPLKTFEVNIKGTWNILEATRVGNVQKLIIASTAHVYGDNPDFPFKEEYYPRPSRPYETSKACADLLAQSYADTYGLPVEIPRFVNIYGPGDLNFSRIVPVVIKSVLNNENPKVWDVGAVRDFLFVEDAVSAYVSLAEKNLPNNKRSRIFNFGSGNPVSIYDLASKIIKISKRNLNIELISVPYDRKNEVVRQYVSITKANKLLGWRPKVSLEKGLELTLEWYEKYLNI